MTGHYSPESTVRDNTIIESTTGCKTFCLQVNTCMVLQATEIRENLRTVQYPNPGTIHISWFVIVCRCLFDFAYLA